MKLVVAIIRPEKLEDVQRALAERDVYLMTVSDVRGCGRQRGYTEVYRGTEVQIRLVPKLKLEIAVNEAFVEATVEAIVHAARTGDTGNVGDGKIFVLPLEDCVRIRTGERGRRRSGRRAVGFRGSGRVLEGPTQRRARDSTRPTRRSSDGRGCRVRFRRSTLGCGRPLASSGSGPPSRSYPVWPEQPRGPEARVLHEVRPTRTRMPSRRV